MTTVEIVTIGDEILIGEIVDTNSAWLGLELNKKGYTVKHITTVGDEEQDMIDSIETALGRADVVLVTGGLGPTNDDKTIATLSKIFNSPLVVDEATYGKVKNMMESRGIAFNKNNQNQALVPECATVIENKNGTAPITLYERGKSVLISMPGVPFEMKAVCNDSVFDILDSRFPQSSNVHISALVYGIAESMLAERLEEWENNLPENFNLAYLPSPAKLRLRLSVYDAEDKEETTKEIYRLFDIVKNLLGDKFLGYEGGNLETDIFNIFKENKATLSLAESCSGGSIAKRITSISGASSFFQGSIVCYSNDIKENVLGVNGATLKKYGAVSKEVVEEMAENACRLFKTDYSISVSGIAGPSGGTTEKPVGTVWFGIRTPKKTYSYKKTFGKLREQNVEYATNNALFALLETINKEK